MRARKRFFSLLCAASLMNLSGWQHGIPAASAAPAADPVGKKIVPAGAQPATHSADVKKLLDEAQALMSNSSQAYDKTTGKFDDQFYRNNLSQVEAKLHQAVDLAEKQNVPLDQAQALYSLGDCCLYQKRYQEAVEAFSQSINRRKQANPVDTIEVADAYAKIAMCKNMGQLDKATMIDDVRNSYEIYSKFMPPDDQRLLFDVKMLAEYAASPEDAVQYRKQTVQIVMTSYGSSQPLLVGSEIFMLSIELGNSGQLNEAIETAQQAIAWCGRAGGYGAYSNYMAQTSEHWKRQLSGLEPAWEVVYHGRYAGRNPRRKPERPNPPTVLSAAGMQPPVTPYVSPGPPEQPHHPSTPTTPPLQPVLPPPTGTAVNVPGQLAFAPVKRRHQQAPDSSGRRYYVDGKEVSKEIADSLTLSNDACDLITAHKFVDAREKLVEAVSLNPDSSNAQSNLGVVLAKLGQKAEAVEHIKRAVQLDPKSASPLSMLASVYQSNGQLEESIATYTDYMNKFPNESDITFVKTLVNDLSKVLAAQKAVIASNPGADTAQDYLVFCTAKEKVRWETRAIRVYIAPGSGVKNFQSGFDKVLRESFADWVNGTGGLISIQYVNSKSDSDVDCFFTDNFGQVHSLAEGGETQMRFDSTGSFKHCSIVLLTAHATNTLAPTENELREVCLHEIGHSLGLAGHSPDANDIMYCSESEVETKRPQLTARDLATLKRLYS